MSDELDDTLISRRVEINVPAGMTTEAFLGEVAKIDKGTPHAGVPTHLPKGRMVCSCGQECDSHIVYYAHRGLRFVVRHSTEGWADTLLRTHLGLDHGLLTYDMGDSPAERINAHRHLHGLGPVE